MFLVFCAICGERRGGFLLNSIIVPFKLLDVCLGLGLRIVGDVVDLDEVVIESVCTNIF